jgi:hypothetical protein
LLRLSLSASGLAATEEKRYKLEPRTSAQMFLLYTLSSTDQMGIVLYIIFNYHSGKRTRD